VGSVLCTVASVTVCCVPLLYYLCVYYYFNVLCAVYLCTVYVLCAFSSYYLLCFAIICCGLCTVLCALCYCVAVTDHAPRYCRTVFSFFFLDDTDVADICCNTVCTDITVYARVLVLMIL
jgi:hypothetical protein